MSTAAMVSSRPTARTAASRKRLRMASHTEAAHAPRWANAVPPRWAEHGFVLDPLDDALTIRRDAQATHDGHECGDEHHRRAQRERALLRDLDNLVEALPEDVAEDDERRAPHA